MSSRKKKKTCFVISPIGADDSDDRKWADEVLRLIVEPAARGYEVIRADMIGKPGMITTQIIELLIKADLVVADLSGSNPNVFYELAIRHFVGKPVVQITKKGEKIPFDVGGMRTLFYDRETPSSFVECGDKMKEFIEAIESGHEEPKNPITEATGILKMSESEHPIEAVSTRLMSMLQEVRSMVSDVLKTRPVVISQTSPNPLDDWITVPPLNLSDSYSICIGCLQVRKPLRPYLRKGFTVVDPLGTIRLCDDCATKFRESGEIV